MTRARVVGLGQPAAGDDGVGAAVVQALQERSLPRGVEVRHLSEPSALVELLDANVPVVIVDAVLGAPAGEVVELGVAELAARAPRRVSSHGLGVAEAAELAGALSDGKEPASIRVVAVTIARPDSYGRALSPEVAAAVPRAAARVLELLGVGDA